ncbi:MAG: hypothetical protein QM496_19035 [Verrucomicrobiota bacterium]
MKTAPNRFSLFKTSALLTGMIALAAPQALQAIDDFEFPPISYSDTKPNDRITQLQSDTQSGKLKFTQKTEKDFVGALLKELNIPASSQALVFSKTSLQTSAINPGQPRAIYFNEEVYFGWTRNRDLELMAAEPKLGVTFYLIHRDPKSSKLSYEQHTDECFSCHASGRTGGRPGMVVRSVLADAKGFPIFSAGSYTTDQSSPIAQRWGGWYVTGHHGELRHMGNAIAIEVDKGNGAEIDREAGANMDELDEFIDPTDYLVPDSDIVALMVLEHQVGMHNRLIEGNYVVRKAIYRDQEISRELGENRKGFSDTTKRIIDHQSERILNYLLFANEVKLTGGGLDSDSTFVEDFQHNAKVSKDGRSLKDFQLLSRIFKYRCSYMIYSSSFESLPKPLKNKVYRRLGDVLTGKDTSNEYAYLKESERKRILNILIETLPDAPASWKKGERAKQVTVK